MKRFISITLVLLMLVSLAACGNSAPKETEFTHSSNLKITLTEAFKEADYQEYTVCYDSEDIAVFVIKEEFSLKEGFADYSLAEYAELVREANSAHLPTETEIIDGLTTFEYGYFNNDDKITYKYFTTMFKGDDAFWTVQFACNAIDYDNLKTEMIKYAQSVKVNG